MEFTKKDKEFILKLYNGDQKTFDGDIRQIEEAAEVTAYSVMQRDGKDEKPITRIGAIRLLGREGWLSGLVRSAFHGNSMRETKGGNRYVYFDSRELFK